MADALAGPAQVMGDVVHDVAITNTSTNPLLIGGRASTATPTSVTADGDAVHAWFFRTGSQAVTLVDTGGNLTSQSIQPSDATANGLNTMATLSHTMGFNGSTWDRARTAGIGNGVAGTGIMAVSTYLYNGTNHDQPRSTTGLEGTGDNSPITGLIASGIGPGFDRRDNPTALGTVVGNTSTFDVNGSAQVLVYIGTGTTGTFLIEVTADGTNYINAVGYSSTLATYGTLTNLTPVNGAYYRVPTGGWRQLRLRTATTLGGTMSHFFNGTLFPTVGIAPSSAVISGSVSAGADGTTMTGWIGPDGQDDLSPVPIGNHVFNGSGWDRQRGSTTGTFVSGDVAHDSPIDANPLLMGARASSGAPAGVSADGDAVRLWALRNGSLAVSLTDQNGNLESIIQPFDGQSNATGTLPVSNLGSVFGGTTWDRARSTTAVEGTGDNTPLVGVPAAGVGPGFNRQDNPSNLGTVVSNVTTFDVNGAEIVRIGTNTGTTGTFTIEATADNTNWVAPEAYDAGSDVRVTGTALTPTAGKVFLVKAAGFRQIRLRTVTTLGATMAHHYTGALGASGIQTLVTPFLSAVALLQASARYTSTQTSTNLIAGTAAQKIYVSQVSIATGGTTAVRVSVYYGTGAFSSGTTPTIFDGEFAPSATVRPGAVLNFPIPTGGSSAAADNLRVTTDAAGTVYVTVHYYKA